MNLPFWFHQISASANRHPGLTLVVLGAAAIVVVLCAMSLYQALAALADWAASRRRGRGTHRRGADRPLTRREIREIDTALDWDALDAEFPAPSPPASSGPS